MTVYNPWASCKEVEHEYKLQVTQALPTNKFDAIVLTVAYSQFLEMDLKKMLKPEGVIYDVKGILKQHLYAQL